MVTRGYVSLPPVTAYFRIPLREISTTLSQALKSMFCKFQIISMCCSLLRSCEVISRGCLRACRANMHAPPPTVNFLPGLPCRVCMLIEKLKQHRKYYLIPMALAVKIA